MGKLMLINIVRCVVGKLLIILCNTKIMLILIATVRFFQHTFNHKANTQKRYRKHWRWGSFANDCYSINIKDTGNGLTFIIPESLSGNIYVPHISSSANMFLKVPYHHSSFHERDRDSYPSFTPDNRDQVKLNHSFLPYKSCRVERRKECQVNKLLRRYWV